MRLVYARLSPGNFGDELNAYLWPRLLPGAWRDDDHTDFIGIGTILSPALARNERRKVVFGAGAGYARAPRLDAWWCVEFVRGPHTARALGLAGTHAITDAAYCLAFDEAHRPGSRSGAVAFMPHFRSEPEVDWRGLCRDLGWRYVSPTAPVPEAIDALASARIVVAEAMHGAIVADVHRVPWVPVRYGYRGLDFKWHDWCASLRLPYEPLDLPRLLDVDLSVRERGERLARRTLALARVGKAAWRAAPLRRSDARLREEALRRLADAPSLALLSPEPVFVRNQARLWDKLEALRQRHGIAARMAQRAAA